MKVLNGRERQRVDGWLPETVSPLTPSSHTFTARGCGGVGGGSREGWERWRGVIARFRFHSVVAAGGGMGEGRWRLWERVSIKSREGVLWICLIAPQCIFFFLVIPASVGPADGLILSCSLCLLKRAAILMYPRWTGMEERGKGWRGGGGNRVGTASRVEATHNI